MKSVFLAVCVITIGAMLAPGALASQVQEFRDEADQYYQEQNFKKAYRVYYKLAKVGDHYSQHRISQMHANGEGTKLDLTEAYAWSALAAESGKENLINSSDELLQMNDDKARAEKRAAKLKKKYGKEVLTIRAKKQAERDSYSRSGRCTGSNLGCARS